MQVKKVSVKTTYMEIRKPYIENALVLPENIKIYKIEELEVNEYLKIYKRVGEKWGWTGRLLLETNELQTILNNKLIEFWYFDIDNKHAGFFEIDRTTQNEIELVYMGLKPEFIGKGFGKHLLDSVVITAKTYSPDRIWLHTCEFDHKNAIKAQ